MAVTPEQITVLSLPTARRRRQLTAAASRARRVQAEAIPPDTLAEIIRDAIEVRIEHAIYEAVLAQEQAVRGEARSSS
jgi:hypothetical protein